LGSSLTLALSSSNFTFLPRFANLANNSSTDSSLLLFLLEID
jgi:hypothetical protein